MRKVNESASLLISHEPTRVEFIKDKARGNIMRSKIYPDKQHPSSKIYISMKVEPSAVKEVFA